MNSIPKYSVINFDDKVEVFKTNGVITSVRIFDKIYKTIPEEKIVEEFERNKHIRFIYLTLVHINRNNGKTIDDFFYVGQHFTRLKSSIFKYHGSGKIIKNIIKKHPGEYEKCYLFICSSKDDMDKKEKMIVNKYLINIKPYCLNLRDGGNQPKWMDYKTKEEIDNIYLKLSDKLKKYCKNHPERLEKSSNFMKEYFKDENKRKYRGEKIKEWNKTYILEKILSHEKQRKTFIENHSLSVSVYDLDGNFIRKFKHSTDCVDYLFNTLKVSKNKLSIRSFINKSVRREISSIYNFQFKHFDNESPLKIKPSYSKISFVVYSNKHKPIYIFHSMNQFTDILSSFISKTALEMARIINSRIVNNTPFLNMYYKRIKHISEQKLNDLIEELKNSKPSDIFKYIDFNQIRSHRHKSPK